MVLALLWVLSPDKSRNWLPSMENIPAAREFRRPQPGSLLGPRRPGPDAAGQDQAKSQCRIARSGTAVLRDAKAAGLPAARYVALTALTSKLSDMLHSSNGRGA